MLEHSPDITWLLDTTLSFHQCFFFFFSDSDIALSFWIIANFEETVLAPSDQRHAASPEAREEMKGQAAPGHMIAMSQPTSPCHLPPHDTWNFSRPFLLRTLCRVMARTSFYPPPVKIILLLVVCFWCVHSPLRIVWVGEVDVHLTQKQKRKYSLSGADVEDVPRGGKGWN